MIKESSCVYVKHATSLSSREIVKFYDSSITDLAPNWSTPFIALVDGKPVLRRYWDTALLDNRVLVFIDARALPQGGGGSDPIRTLAMLGVLGLSLYFPFLAPGFAADAMFLTGMGSAVFWNGLAQGAILFGGMVAVNAVLPPEVNSLSNGRNLPEASPTYDLQAQGNYARLENAIPEHFGRLSCYPDFAATPYTEANSNEIFLYQLLCIGRGYYDIESIMIEDSVLENFDDVEHEVYEPGEEVTLFPTSVEVSTEVSGQDLPVGSWVGPFTAVSEGKKATHLGIDLSCPRGIYHFTGSGKLEKVTINADIQARRIDDDGERIGSWFDIKKWSINKKSTTPQRFSLKLPVPVRGRYEVRICRRAPEYKDTSYGHDLVWAGLKSYLVESNNFGDCTLLAVKMRATSQLSSTASRKFRVLCTRKLPIWDGSSWLPMQATRSIAWAAAYVCKQVGIPDRRIDLNTLLYLDGVWKSRKDECNGRIDSFLTFWEALSKVCLAGRCKPFFQAGVVRFFRDELQELPVAAFNTYNIVKGSFNIQYLMPTEETADSIQVSYFDEKLWKQRRVLAQLEESNAETPAKLDISFITNRARAKEYGLYMAACNQRRRKMISFSTEMEGFIPVFGDLISIQHDMPAWGQSGECVDAYMGANYVPFSTNYGEWDRYGLMPFGSGSDLYDHTSPIGDETASKVVEDTSFGQHSLHAHAVFVDNSLVTGYAYLKASERSIGCVSVFTSEGVYVGAKFNLLTGEVFEKDEDCITASIEPSEEGFFLCSVLVDISDSELDAKLRVAIARDDGTVYYTGDGVSGIELWGCGLGTLPYLPTIGSRRKETVVLTSENLTWSEGLTHYVALADRVNAVLGPYVCSSNSIDDNVLVVSDGEGLNLNDIRLTDERTVYQFGWGDTVYQRALVLSVKPSNQCLVTIEAVNEDDAVHTADTGVMADEPIVSQLPGDTTSPAVTGLVVVPSPMDIGMMLLSWNPAPWSEYYIVEVSADGETWTRIGEPTSSDFSYRALYGDSTLIRVAAVGVARGPWSYAMFSSGVSSDYMWVVGDDADIMWDGETSGEVMWGDSLYEIDDAFTDISLFSDREEFTN